MIKIMAIPANIRHIVDGTGAPEHFATRPGDLAVVKMGFFFGRIGPVHSGMSQFEGLGGIMDFRHRIIIATGFE
jgi:hypothetical protein